MSGNIAVACLLAFVITSCTAARTWTMPWKDILVYGGATFVSSLIEHGLIDEMNFFVNPVAIGNGMRVFKGRKPLKLAASTAYPCGIVVNSYLPQ